MLVRIDDYPTGVRPKLDISIIHRILGTFDKLGIICYVGVVPALIKYEKVFDFANCYAIQHGYDHKYDVMSKKCIENNDVYNEKTVGNFDEFLGKQFYEIESLLAEGWKIIDKKFKNKKRWFVPVCNIINHQTAKALAKLKYENILSENSYGRLNVVKSDFYGRVKDLDFSKNYEVISLHVTWEYDTIRERGWKEWEALMIKLAEYYHKKNGTTIPKKEKQIPTTEPFQLNVRSKRLINYKDLQLDYVRKKSIARTIKEPDEVTDYKILFKFPTRYRNAQFFKTLDLYYSMIEGSKFEFVISADLDDASMNNDATRKRLEGYKNLTIKYGNNKSKIEAVNADIPYNSWDIVVLVSDDMHPQVKGFDNIIRAEMQKHFADTDGVLWFNDGCQKEALNTLSIVGRRYYDRFGYLYHPDYLTIRCDNEFMEVANRLKKQVYFDKVIIKHNHPSFNKNITKDVLYKKNSSNDLFVKDKEIYIKRKQYGFPNASVSDFGTRIPKVAYFYWNNETPLSYLRYLTMLTFRYNHPDWGMILYVSGSKTETQWKGREKQDFQLTGMRDYMPEVCKLNVEVREFRKFELNPNYISDIFRWEILNETGGWYFDMDQVFYNNFDEFLDYDFVFGCEKHNYSGVLGCKKGCELPKNMSQKIAEVLAKKTPTSYCEIGNWLFSDNLKNQKVKYLRTANEVFYPITESDNVDLIYNGKLVIDMTKTWALHWFGGHPKSQIFAKNYTEEYAKTGEDTISRYLRLIEN